jgi:hypothetical protein
VLAVSFGNDANETPPSLRVGYLTDNHEARGSSLPFRIVRKL